MTPCEILAVHERLTLCCAGGTPVPVSDSTVGELEASLRKVMLPDTTPFPDGVNFTVNCTCWPAGIVTGKLIPLSEKAEPLTVPDDTVTSATVAFKVPVRCACVPTVTFPKSMLVGTTLNCPCGGGVPVPL